MTEKKPGEPDERDKQAFLDIRAAWQRGGLDPGFTAVARYREEIESRALADAKRFTTLTEYEEELEKARREGFEAGESLMHAHCLADEINQHRSEWKQEGAREALERAAKICHDLYAETGRYLGPLIRALADQPEAVVQRHLQCGYPLDQCKCKPAKAEHICGLSGYNPMIDPPCPHPSHAKADALPLGHAYTGMGDSYGCTHINQNPTRIVCCGEPEAAHGRK